jgi:hypothetical protein
MEMTEDDVREALKKVRNDFVKLKTFYPDEATMDLKQRLLAITGLAIDTANYGTLRYYPNGKSLCHIVGYAGIISKKEKINYKPMAISVYDAANDRFVTTPTRYNGDSYIGKYGLELLYEDHFWVPTDALPTSKPRVAAAAACSIPQQGGGWQRPAFNHYSRIARAVGRRNRHHGIR